MPLQILILVDQIRSDITWHHLQILKISPQVGMAFLWSLLTTQSHSEVPSLTWPTTLLTCPRFTEPRCEEDCLVLENVGDLRQKDPNEVHGIVESNRLTMIEKQENMWSFCKHVTSSDTTTPISTAELVPLVGESIVIWVIWFCLNMWVA